MSKKTKKPKKPLKTTQVEYPIEKVFWKDHFSSNSGWTTRDKLTGAASPMICASVGINVLENKEVLVLAQNMSSNHSLADTVTILKNCITKRSKIGSMFYDKV